MEYSSLPKDPVMLLSFVNTKLRDDFDSLAEFCSNYEVTEAEITKRLSEINYSYNKELNRFT